MSLQLVEVSQVASIVIACCSVSALIMGIHLCQFRNIKHMNLCGHCFTMTQFSVGHVSPDAEDEQPVAPLRFSRDIQITYPDVSHSRVAPR